MKINCKATRVATYLKNDPKDAVLEHTGAHGHELDDTEDLQHLILSAAINIMIETRLWEGYRKRYTRVAIQNSLVQYIKASFNNASADNDGPYHTIVHSALHFWV